MTDTDWIPSKDRHGAAVSPTGHVRERLAAALYFANRHYYGGMVDPIPVDQAYPRYLFEPADYRANWERKADLFLQTLDHLGLAIEDRRDDAHGGADQ